MIQEYIKATDAAPTPAFAPITGDMFTLAIRLHTG